MKQINEINKSIKKDIIVENLMISNGVYLLVSHPKVGKSIFAQQLAFSLTTGEDFLGFKVNSSHVLYITTEGDINQLQDRFKLMNFKKLITFGVLSRGVNYIFRQNHNFFKKFTKTTCKNLESHHLIQQI